MCRHFFKRGFPLSLFKQRRRDRWNAVRAAVEAVEPRRLLAASLVADINLDTASSNPAQFTQLGSSALFVASNPGPQLWRTDGTAAGTSLVVSGNSDFSMTLMPALSPGVELFFNGDLTHGRELWRTDGTSGGTSFVKD